MDQPHTLYFEKYFLLEPYSLHYYQDSKLTVHYCNLLFEISQNQIVLILCTQSAAKVSKCKVKLAEDKLQQARSWQRILQADGKSENTSVSP